jgi:hypothetical protein
MVSKLGRNRTNTESTVSVARLDASEGFGERVLDRVREAFCGLHGHDNLLQFGQDRMFLKCVSCGHESPGWELNEPRPTDVDRIDRPRRPLSVPRTVVDERRIA